MEIKFYIKTGLNYELRELKPASQSTREFFQNLLLNVEEQINIIKNDMLDIAEKDTLNFVYPKHDDYVIQKKLDLLSELRQTNIKAREQIKTSLQENEFIICECGCKMYKCPLGVPFRKVGTGFILLEKSDFVEYLYRCESCWRAINEIIVKEEQKYKKLREDLLSKGNKWVPNNNGVWYNHKSI